MQLMKVYHLPPFHRLLTIIASVLFTIECFLLFSPILTIFKMIIAVDALPFLITTCIYFAKGTVAAIPSTALTSILYMSFDSYNQKFQTERTLIRLLVVQKEAPLTNDKIASLQPRYPDIIYTYRLMQLLGKEPLTKRKHVKHAYKHAFQSCTAQDLKVLNDFGTSAKMIITLLTNGRTSVFMYRSLYKKEIIHWCEALEETLGRKARNV
ncbi:hypothetical protein [Kurthia massiliensis]|uniref:hypothetical protein n=1 Tax=Kurthia massiliensis TaxID=1033739 RepID=UPI000288D95D|nr:hypothetical protein [Kurthia massiliensis]